MKLILVGVSGKMRTGKDTVADRLVREWGFKRMALADKIREICRDFLDFPPDEFGPGPKTARARMALQLLGTEVGRELDPDVWIKNLFSKIVANMGDLAHHDPRPEKFLVVAPDIRFPNEVQAIQTLYGLDFAEGSKGSVWRILRDAPISEIQNPGHSSETALDTYDDFDEQIDNRGTMEQLHTTIDRLAKGYLQ